MRSGAAPPALTDFGPGGPRTLRSCALSPSRSTVRTHYARACVFARFYCPKMELTAVLFVNFRKDGGRIRPHARCVDSRMYVNSFLVRGRTNFIINNLLFVSRWSDLVVKT